jgi:hypothetical protein
MLDAGCNSCPAEPPSSAVVACGKARVPDLGGHEDTMRVGRKAHVGPVSTRACRRARLARRRIQGVRVVHPPHTIQQGTKGRGRL